MDFSFLNNSLQLNKSHLNILSRSDRKFVNHPASFIHNTFNTIWPYWQRHRTQTRDPGTMHLSIKVTRFLILVEDFIIICIINMHLDFYMFVERGEDFLMFGRFCMFGHVNEAPWW